MIFLFVIPDCVRDEQKQAPFDFADCLPSFLTVLDAVLFDQSEGVVESQRGGIEADPMLAPVARCFGNIPFESCLYVICYYNFVG